MLQPLFWDVPFETIHAELHKRYVVARILELGGEAAVKWAENHYSLDDLRSVVETSRSLSSKSRNYWRIRYHLG